MKKILSILLSLSIIFVLISCAEQPIIVPEKKTFETDSDVSNFEVDASGNLTNYYGDSHVVVLPNTVKTIKKDAFKNKMNLFSITFNSGLENIEVGAFNGCFHLIEVYNLSRVNVVSERFIIHKDSNAPSVLKLSPSQFVYYTKNNRNLLLAYIGELVDIIVPSNITDIDSYAFYNDKTLKTVTLTNQIETIGDYAFYGCNNLATLSLSGNLLKIGQYSFAYNSSLTKLTLHNKLDNIMDNAFLNDCHLVEIYNLSKLELSIGDNNYGGVSKFAKVIHNSISEKSNLVDENEYTLYQTDEDCELILYRGSNNIIEIPSKVTTINDYSFLAPNADIVSVSISSNVKTITDNAFKYEHLVEVYNASTVDVLSYNSFILDVYYDQTMDSKLLIESDGIYRVYNNNKELIALYRYATYLQVIDIDIINSYAFSKNDSESIVLSKDINEIKSDAFRNSSIKDIFFLGSKEDIDLTGLNLDGITFYYYSEENIHDGNHYWHQVGVRVIIWED